MQSFEAAVDPSSPTSQFSQSAGCNESSLFAARMKWNQTSQFSPALNPFPFRSRKLPPNHRAMKNIRIVTLTEEVWHPTSRRPLSALPHSPSAVLHQVFPGCPGPMVGSCFREKAGGVCLPTPAAHLRREQQSHVHALNYTTPN